MRPPAPAPVTVPPQLAAKQNVLQRARAAADAHGSGMDGPPKKISSDWRDFFTKQEQVKVESSKCIFNVYIAGDHGPVVFCLHGAGYTGLTFALVAEELSREYVIQLTMPSRAYYGLAC
jgi:acetyl esterase/lipase